MTYNVSVVMPVYNTANRVWTAIESILNQTFTNFEFIIVDDCSTDWSYEICYKYSKKDSRIKLYKNDKNMWINYTRKRLLTLVKWKYIALQDSDDVSKKDRLDLEYKFLLNNKDFAVVSWYNEIIDENSDKIWFRKYSNKISSIILKKNPISNPSCMISKKAFDDVWWYSNDLNYWEDYDLWLKMYLKWYKIKILSNTLLEYRVRSWQTKSDKLKETLKNTIFLQKKYSKLWIPTNFSDKVYRFIENILLCLPSDFILFLFKKIHY